ncbi:MAG TPA: two-component regulator propeller domain-containing protein [Puia sp.]|nr:two-component regulator propeller domain-containing protein [Puia sp.]
MKQVSGILLSFCYTAIFVPVIFITGESFSQNSPFIFHHISTLDGLPSANVNSILQDKNGYIWVATNDGLQKYDGYTFQSFHHDPLNEQSLSSDILYSLLEDDQNNIWSISFLAGFNKFNTLTARNLRLNDLDNALSKDFFRSTGLCKDKDGNIWLIGTENIARYDVRSSKIEFIKDKFPATLHPYFIAAQLDASKNQLWLADLNQGVCMYDLAEKVFYCHDYNPKKLSVFDLDFRPMRLYLDKEKNLWVIGNEISLAKYDPESGLSVTYQLYASPNYSIVNVKKKSAPKGYKPVSISAMLEDSRHQLWLGSGSLGLMEYQREKDSFMVVSSENNMAIIFILIPLSIVFQKTGMDLSG